jgi:hypothetical protein
MVIVFNEVIKGKIAEKNVRESINYFKCSREMEKLSESYHELENEEKKQF